MKPNHDYPGKFIILEGCEGAGKTTLIKSLKLNMQNFGYKVVATKEPDCGTPRCKQICKDLLSPEKSLTVAEELDLMIECRKENFGKIVIPALKTGKFVLCDRSYPSTIAYQHYGAGFDLTEILKADAIARQNVSADLILLLDIVDPVAGLKRKNIESRFEKKDIEFHQRVRKGYLQQWYDDNDGNWRHIDASSSRENVREKALKIVFETILRERKNNASIR
ncbi:MAG: dTMP kinase [Candidatus Brennerbacteria bacterium]|nr:dTMP kinase [Candidatus Brennerbacteria bacterium]